MAEPRNTESPRHQPHVGRLGTFGGVFAPSILTILGIILFLRFGYVVGSGGLGRALLILAIATAITTLTSTSLSAIATNLRAKGGGDYYLISRTLGPGFGGALGVVLFLAQSVSIAFYCIGFAEAIGALMGRTDPTVVRPIAAGAIAFLFIFAWLGADWATRFQYFVMAVLIAALASFFFGGIDTFSAGRLAANFSAPRDGPPFWALFAIFFPAVTGFTQGVSMSGDLKDPGRSLPRGTFWAVGISTLIYLAVALVFAGSLSQEQLAQSGGESMRRLARYDWLISAGVVAATLSSGMASFLGAPRILQSMARDRIFAALSPFAHGVGPASNPRRAVMLSAAIALATVAAGDLNLVAPVVSMFFLISYGLLNYATYYEARTSSPAFRPTFRFFHPRLSLLGALGCLGAMVAISPAAGAAGCAVLFAIYQYLKRRAGIVGFHDSTRANAFQRVREHLLDMAAETEHARDWRPQLLAFSDHEHRRERLLRFASWVEGGSGVTSAIKVIEGTGTAARKQAEEAQKQLAADITKHRLPAFALAVAAPDFASGLEMLLQSYGVGPLRANTILLNWLDEDTICVPPERGEVRFGQNLRIVLRQRRNVVVLDADDESWKRALGPPPDQRRIDVWWLGRASSRLMLLLAFLMTRAEPWRDATIRVYAPCRDGDPPDEALLELRQTLEEIRIVADAQVVPSATAQSIVQRSSDASIVFLPLRLSKEGPQIPIGPENGLRELLTALPVCALCIAGQDIELEAEPDEGKQAEMAEAAQKLAKAQQRVEQVERRAAEAVEQAQQQAEKMQEVMTSGEGLEKVAAAVSAASDASRQADAEARRLAKIKAKAQHAAQDARDLGVVPPESPSSDASPPPA